MPLRERNRLLEAGGFAHLYRETAFAAEEMRHIRDVLQFILDRHKPYAAVVLDRYSNCLLGNGASDRLLAAVVDADLITEHANHLRLAFHPRGARRYVVNWDDVGRHLLERAERELGHVPDDAVASALLAELRDMPGRCADIDRRRVSGANDLLLPVHVRKDGVELRLFSTIMTLGTPQDVTLQELRIETFFPADAESEVTWRRLMGEL